MSADVCRVVGNGYKPSVWLWYCSEFGGKTTKGFLVCFNLEPTIKRYKWGNREARAPSVETKTNGPCVAVHSLSACLLSWLSGLSASWLFPPAAHPHTCSRSSKSALSIYTFPLPRQIVSCAFYAAAWKRGTTPAWSAVRPPTLPGLSYLRSTLLKSQKSRFIWWHWT